jgi:hypothetical protein
MNCYVLTWMTNKLIDSDLIALEPGSIWCDQSVIENKFVWYPWEWFDGETISQPIVTV